MAKKFTHILVCSNRGRSALPPFIASSLQLEMQWGGKDTRTICVFTVSNDTQEECKRDIEQGKDISLITRHWVLRLDTVVGWC